MTSLHLPHSRTKLVRPIAVSSAIMVLMLGACGGGTHTAAPASAGDSGTSGAADAGSAGTTAGSPAGGQPALGGGPGLGGSSGFSGSSGSIGDGGDSSGAGSSSGSSAGGSPALGGACSPAASLACAGEHQKVTLICGADGSWQVNMTCAVGEFCDSRAGDGLGLCAKEVAECAGKAPGDLVCLNDTVHRCGPDAVSSDLVETCTGYCDAGACVNDKDMCPDPAISVNCATDCGARSTYCKTNAAGCQIETVNADGSAELRMPSPSDTCACEKNPDRRVVMVSYWASTWLKVKAPMGWKMVDKVVTRDNLDSTADWCDQAVVDCLVLPPLPSGSFFKLVSTTTDPGPRNLVLEAVSGAMATCP